MYTVEEISLELTNSCPLACAHCSSGSAPPKLPDELTFAEHCRLLEEARDLGATVLSLSGGTPLNYEPHDERLSGALPALIGKARNLAYDLILIYVTGQSRYGPHIKDYPHIDSLLGLPQVIWIFSLHSYKDDVNDAIMRREGALQEIIKSIKWLRERGEIVEVHMVPMKPNWEDIGGVRALCSWLMVSKLSLLRFVPQTRGKDNIDRFGMTREEFVLMQCLLHKEVMLNGSHPVDVRLGCPIDFRHAIGLTDAKVKPCHAGDDLILVRPQGNVHPCAAWKSLPVDANVRGASLKSIWENSEVFNAIRLFKTGRIANSDTRYTPGYQTLEGLCASCNMLDSCLAGCPAQRLHATGSEDLVDLLVSQPDPLCPRGGS